MTNIQNAGAAPVSAAVETSDLKDKFRARSIPLEKDFHDLIDMADAGRLAAGLSPDQENTKATAKTGLTIGADNRLGVKLKTGGGLDVAPDGVSVKKGNGIDASADAVTVKTVANGGLDVAPEGVSVKKGNGIDSGADAVTVKTVANGGLVVGPDGLGVSVDGAKGIVVGTVGIGIDDRYSVRLMARVLGGADFYVETSYADVFIKVMPAHTFVTWCTHAAYRTTSYLEKPLLDGYHPTYLNSLGGSSSYNWASYSRAARPGSVLSFDITQSCPEFEPLPGDQYHASSETCTIAEADRL